MRPSQEAVSLLWEPQRAEVAESGELGYTWGLYTLVYSGDDGEDVTEIGKYLNIWKKQADGMWRVAIDMGNPNG